MIFSRKIEISKAMFILGIVFVLILPFLVHGQTVPPNQNTGITYECTRGAPGECKFEDLVLATIRVVNFGTVFALMFTVVVIAFAGWKYMISGGVPAKRQEANKTLLNAAIGIVIILAAWLIVRLITSTLLNIPVII